MKEDIPEFSTMLHPNPKLSIFVLPSVALIAIFVLTVSWVGFYGGDDFKYYRAAKDWLQPFPPDITQEGAMRLGITLPLAISLSWLGDSEFAAILPTSLYYAAFILFVAYALRRLTDPVTVIVACAVLASVPVLAIHSTTPSADLANLLYASLSFFFFYVALDHQRRNVMLYLSGIFAGIAFMSHEQVLALIIFYGMLFLAGYRMKRQFYLYLAAGFVTVLFAEMLFYVSAGYNPLHHFTWLLGAAQHEDRWADPEPKVGGIDNAGNLYIWPPINPIILTLITQKYGILYYLLYPALWWIVRGHIIRDEATTRVLRLLAVLGTVWFLFAVIALSQIKLYARYYLAPTSCFFIIGVFWLRYVVWPSRKKMAVFAVLSVLVVNFLCLGVENKDPRFGDRALLTYLNISEGEIATDVSTARLATYFCYWQEKDCSRIIASEPVFGSVYFLNPNNSDITPGPQWKEIWRLEQPRKWPGQIITSLNLESVVPRDIFRRLNQPNKAVAVYEIPSKAYGLQQ